MLNGIPSRAKQRAKEKREKRKKARPRNGHKNNVQLESFLKTYIRPKYKAILKEAFRAYDEKKGKTHKYVDIYKIKAGISKQVFYEMLKRPPEKETLIKMAFVLEVTYKMAKELLESANYSFKNCSYRDLIFKFCFKRGIFDILKVNEFLKQHKETPLPLYGIRKKSIIS